MFYYRVIVVVVAAPKIRNDRVSRVFTHDGQNAIASFFTSTFRLSLWQQIFLNFEYGFLIRNIVYEYIILSLQSNNRLERVEILFCLEFMNF